MNREDIDLLIEQIRNIILNKPLTNVPKSESEELADLQEAVAYLADCLTESNEFLRHLRMGDLNVKPPSRHNFLAGNLKELHSALKHLTWQANQVANGDYSQSVHFLGDFSASFNQMIRQLADREAQLKVQSGILSETVELMKSVMDGLKEWIVVTSQDSGQVIYANQAATVDFFDAPDPGDGCQGRNELLRYMQEYDQERSESRTFEYQCEVRKKTFLIRSYAVHWSGKLAYAHIISDVTVEKEYQSQMEELAYLDPLTGLHNRRYCLEHLDRLVAQRAAFTFCMIDLDRLKFANDHFGHSAGDEYLKTVAAQLRSVTRATDLVCRIGGDEFAAIFPDCEAPVILNKMEVLDKRLAEMSDQFPMSISYGVTDVQAGTSTSSGAVMELADQKMYVLKNVKRAARYSRDGFVMTFTWSRDLETGNPQIDQEHHELIQAFNRLLAACAGDDPGDELNRTMDFLAQYTKNHLSREEALQLQFAYPDYHRHKGYHDEFIRVVDELSLRLKTEGPSPALTEDLNRQLGGWLLNHIKMEDAKVAQHIQAQLAQ